MSNLSVIWKQETNQEWGKISEIESQVGRNCKGSTDVDSSKRKAKWLKLYNPKKLFNTHIISKNTNLLSFIVDNNDNKEVLNSMEYNKKKHVF